MQGREGRNEIHLLNRTIDQTANNPRFKDRVTSLAPYIVEIQRRKRLRQLARQSKKNLNQTSSRSFRIKDKSLSNLHKETIAKSKDSNPHTVISKLLEQRAQRDQKTKSLQKHQNIQYSKTIDHRPKKTQHPTANNFFNDLYVRVKSKVQKQKPKKQSKYQTLDGPRSRSQQATANINKIGYTNVIDLKTQENKFQNKKENKKGNFRRGKFEVVSSCNIHNEQLQAKKEQLMSDSKLQLDKKDSNVSINREMDKIALRQMQQFQKLRSKEVHRSVDKSTQKYLTYESYRPAKSKNDIEVILSTAKNPSMHKVSHSTTDKPQAQAFHSNNGHPYDFTFPNQEEQHFSRINELECPSDQDSHRPLGGQTVFIEYNEPQIGWSNDLES